MLTDRTASLPAWARANRVQVRRSGESAIAAEAFMSNAGYNSSKRISTTSYSTILTGVFTSTKSPTRFPISALPTGD